MLDESRETGGNVERPRDPYADFVARQTTAFARIMENWMNRAIDQFEQRLTTETDWPVGEPGSISFFDVEYPLIAPKDGGAMAASELQRMSGVVEYWRFLLPELIKHAQSSQDIINETIRMLQSFSKATLAQSESFAPEIVEQSGDSITIRRSILPGVAAMLRRGFDARQVRLRREKAKKEANSDDEAQSKSYARLVRQDEILRERKERRDRAAKEVTFKLTTDPERGVIRPSAFGRALIAVLSDYRQSLLWDLFATAREAVESNNLTVVDVGVGSGSICAALHAMSLEDVEFANSIQARMDNFLRRVSPRMGQGKLITELRTRWAVVQKIIGVDINPVAVKLAGENLSHLSDELSIEILLSNFFDAIPLDVRIHIAIANCAQAPLPDDEGSDSNPVATLRTAYDGGPEGNRMILDTINACAARGVAQMLFTCTSLANPDAVIAHAAKMGYTCFNAAATMVELNPSYAKVSGIDDANTDAGKYVEFILNMAEKQREAGTRTTPALYKQTLRQVDRDSRIKFGEQVNMPVLAARFDSRYLEAIFGDPRIDNKTLRAELIKTLLEGYRDVDRSLKVLRQEKLAVQPKALIRLLRQLPTTDYVEGLLFDIANGDVTVALEDKETIRSILVDYVEWLIRHRNIKEEKVLCEFVHVFLAVRTASDSRDDSPEATSNV